jgi:hypothetical protein
MRTWVAALLVGLFTSTSGFAHTADLTTARVTLRDGQVAVTAHVDLVEHMERVRPTAPETVPLGLLAVVDPDAFEAIAEVAFRSLRDGTWVAVEGRPLALVGWRFPSPDRLRAVAQHAWMASTVDEHAHRTLTAVSFEARVSRPAQAVTLGMPPELGPVLTSFIQPTSRMAPAGAAVTFDVTARSISVAPPSRAPGPVEGP